MKLSIRTRRRHLSLQIPNAIAMNPFAALLAAGTTNLTIRQAMQLFCAVRQCRRQLPEWHFLDLHTADGTGVTIIL